MSAIIYRVAHRFLRATLGDPKDFLREFEATLRTLEMPRSPIEAARKELRDLLAAGEKTPRLNDASSLAYDAYFKVTKGGARLSVPGHKLFLSILQTYALPPALRKKVEIASRTYLKDGGKPRTKSKYGIELYLEYFDMYDKYMEMVRGHLEVAKLAIDKGVPHAEGGAGATKVKAGSFVLINTGGFSEEVMDNAANIVRKAEALLKSSGVGQVCYGAIQITGTLKRAEGLAFYLLANDELFIRANVKPTIDSIQVVLHELGHRYEHKFLKGKERNVASLYQKIQWQEQGRRYDDKARAKTKALVPKPGEEVKSKGKTYRVVTTLPDKGSYKIQLERVDTQTKAHASLEWWLEAKGESTRNIDEEPDFQGFVTDYAKRSPSENFAEMFAMYCVGRLPVLQSVEFEELVFGTSKTVNERSILRVASRWILEG